MRTRLPDAVLALLTERVGAPRLDAVTRLDRGDGSGRVFGVEILGEPAQLLAARGAVPHDTSLGRIVVKQLAAARTFAQEHEALAGWLAGRTHLGGARVPVLVLADAATRTLAWRRLDGRVPERDAAAAIHRAAGRFLAALHDLDIPDTDPCPLAEALVRRHRAWLAACEGELDARELEVVRELAPRPELHEGAARVPCHRDFTPDNWLWDGRTLAVVDFEHARLDLGPGDLAKLAVGCWADHPELEQAFFHGYGGRPSAIERRRLHGAIALHGIASLAWGLRHAAPRFVEEGRRALAIVAAKLDD